jgi:hypothetical protein
MIVIHLCDLFFVIFDSLVEFFVISLLLLLRSLFKSLFLTIVEGLDFIESLFTLGLVLMNQLFNLIIFFLKFIF